MFGNGFWESTLSIIAPSRTEHCCGGDATESVIRARSVPTSAISRLQGFVPCSVGHVWLRYPDSFCSECLCEHQEIHSWRLSLAGAAKRSRQQLTVNAFKENASHRVTIAQCPTRLIPLVWPSYQRFTETNLEVDSGSDSPRQQRYSPR
jgi:hypothetical protein